MDPRSTGLRLASDTWKADLIHDHLLLLEALVRFLLLAMEAQQNVATWPREGDPAVGISPTSEYIVTKALLYMPSGKRLVHQVPPAHLGTKALAISK